MTYSGYIAELKSVKMHPNADRLKIAEVFGNNVIVGLDMNEGDLVFYMPTDGKVGEEFAIKNKLTRSLGGYLDDEKRHVRAIRLRGEQSDGLIMSISSLESFTDISKLRVGDTINVLNGVVICEKYIPKRTNKPMLNGGNKAKKKKVNRFPLFQEHIDTPQLAYNKGSFREGDLCTITLKLHGTSARISRSIEENNSIFSKLLGKFGYKNNVYKPVSGTRRVVLENFEGGFYGGNEFRKYWHDYLGLRLHKGETIYGEIVGYTKEGQLIMPSCDNKKTNNKEFIKKYGDRTLFTYGCGEGENDFYAYRMTMTNEDGKVFEYPTELAQLRCEQLGINHAPVLDRFFFTTVEDLDKRIENHGDGEDPIGKTHIREGIIVRIEDREKFTVLKYKNWDFKLIEGIVKDAGVLDMEEEQSS